MIEADLFTLQGNFFTKFSNKNKKGEVNAP